MRVTAAHDAVPVELLFAAGRTERPLGSNPTKEQVARALDAICARWPRDQCGTEALAHTVTVIR